MLPLAHSFFILQLITCWTELVKHRYTYISLVPFKNKSRHFLNSLRFLNGGGQSVSTKIPERAVASPTGEVEVEIPFWHAICSVLKTCSNNLKTPPPDFDWSINVWENSTSAIRLLMSFTALRRFEHVLLKKLSNLFGLLNNDFLSSLVISRFSETVHLSNILFKM